MPRRTKTPPPTVITTSSPRTRNKPIKVYAESRLNCSNQRNLIHIKSEFSPPLLGNAAEFCTEAFIKGFPVRGISFSPVKEFQSTVPYQAPCDLCKVEKVQPKLPFSAKEDEPNKLRELCQKKPKKSVYRQTRVTNEEFLSRKFNNVKVYNFEPPGSSEDEEEPDAPNDLIPASPIREPLTSEVAQTKIVETSVDGPLRRPKPRVKDKAQIKAEEAEQFFMNNLYWKWDRPVVAKPQTTQSNLCTAFEKALSKRSGTGSIKGSKWLENNYQPEPQINYYEVIEEEEEDLDEFEMIHSDKITPEAEPEDEHYEETRGPILRIEGKSGNVHLKYCPPGQKQVKIYYENLDRFSASTKCKDVRHIILHNIGTTVIRYQWLRSKPTPHLRNLLKNSGRTLALEVKVVPVPEVNTPILEVQTAEEQQPLEEEYLGEDGTEFSGYDLHEVKNKTALDKPSVDLGNLSIATNNTGIPVHKTSTQMFVPTLGVDVDENGCCTCKCPAKQTDPKQPIKGSVSERSPPKKSDGIIHFNDDMAKSRSSEVSDDSHVMHRQFSSAGTIGVTSSFIRRFIDQRRSSGASTNNTDIAFPSSLRLSEDYYRKFSEYLHGDEFHGEGHLGDFPYNERSQDQIEILKHAQPLQESGQEIDDPTLKFRPKKMSEMHIISPQVFDFHYPSKPSFLLPGQSIKIEIIFRPRKQGFFTETIYLLTHPKLGKSIYSLRLKGICIDPPIRKDPDRPLPEEEVETIRNKVYRKMYETQGFQAAAAIIDHVILLNETRADTLPNGNLTSEAIFKAHNPKFHFHQKYANEGLQTVRKILELLVPADRINTGNFCQLNIEQMYKELLKPANQFEYFTQNYVNSGDEIEKYLHELSQCTKHLAKPRIYYMESREKRMYNAVYSTMNVTLDEILDKITTCENSPGHEYLVNILKRDIHENWMRKELNEENAGGGEEEGETYEEHEIEEEGEIWEELETNREDETTQFPESNVTPVEDGDHNHHIVGPRPARFMSQRLSLASGVQGKIRKYTRKSESSGEGIKSLKPKKGQDKVRRHTIRSLLGNTTKSLKGPKADLSSGDSIREDINAPLKKQSVGTSLGNESIEHHHEHDDDEPTSNSDQSDLESVASAIEPGSQQWFESELKKTISKVQTPFKLEIIESLLGNGIERMISTLDSMTYMQDYEPCQIIKMPKS